MRECKMFLLNDMNHFFSQLFYISGEKKRYFHKVKFTIEKHFCSITVELYMPHNPVLNMLKNFCAWKWA